MTYSADFRAQVIKSVKSKDMRFAKRVLSTILVKPHYSAG